MKNNANKKINRINRNAHSMLLVVLVAIMVSGCVCPSRKTFVDVTQPEEFNYHEKMSVDGQKLIIEVEQIPGLNIVSIHPLILQDIIYLERSAVSSGGAGTGRFELDFSRYNLPDDWSNRIYWIEGRRCPSLSTYLLTQGPHSEEILRRKATLN
jgi:hypothetical protein